jgi:hypothetical protein
MRCTSFCLGLSVLLLAASSAWTQTYTIKLKRGPDAGKTVVVKTSSKNTAKVTVTDPDGNAKDQPTTPKETEEAYTETVIERSDKRATKFKRTYEKSTTTTAGKKQANSYEGRTVVYELKDGKYEVSVEGTPPLPKKDLDDLAKREKVSDADPEDLILPDKPVKVGDKWSLDKQLAKFLKEAMAGGLDVDSEKAKGEVKLEKAYEKDGVQFGVLKLTITVPIKSVGEGAGKMTFDSPATLELKTTLDIAIDGKSTAGNETSGFEMEGKSSVQQMGKTYMIHLKTESTSKKEQSAEK